MSPRKFVVMESRSRRLLWAKQTSDPLFVYLRLFLHAALGVYHTIYFRSLSLQVKHLLFVLNLSFPPIWCRPFFFFIYLNKYFHIYQISKVEIKSTMRKMFLFFLLKKYHGILLLLKNFISFWYSLFVVVSILFVIEIFQWKFQSNLNDGKKVSF